MIIFYTSKNNLDYFMNTLLLGVKLHNNKAMVFHKSEALYSISISIIHNIIVKKDVII